MRKIHWLAPAIGAVAIAGYLIHRPAASEPHNEAANAAAASTLPIRNVVLFSSGVGYFQRKGEVDGNARVDLTFQVHDINDLIKSMVIQDEKGEVSAVSYDSMDPVERTLRSFAVNLNSNPTLVAILTQLRGEKVEVVLNQTATAQPGTITGSIMGLEEQHPIVAAMQMPLEVEVLNMWCAEGVRAIKLADVQRIRFLNPSMEAEFRRALDTLALSHDAEKKAVSISFSGEGKRAVQVGYVVENPIWKTSYRLVLDKDGKPMLQGWAVVDNPTDDDWNQVGMVLISGRPVSFQMDLYQPLYVPRPMAELELFESLRPVAYGGAVGDQKGSAPYAPSVSVTGIPGEFGGGRGNRERIMKAASGAPQPNGVVSGLTPSGTLTPGLNTDEMQAELRRQFANEMRKNLNQRMDLSKGVQSAATASQLGDFFQYIINTPVTMPRQKSALLPIANKEIEATRLSIYNSSVHAKFPMLGLKLKNTSGLHLMQGPITVFEGSTYAGDARINDVSPGDDRLISYAVDLGTEVEAKSLRKPERLTNVKIENGVIVRTDRIREEITYTATNRSGQEKTLWIEHPYRPQFKLVSDVKPAERTSDHYRFEIKLPAKAKESVTETVAEEQDVDMRISISNANDGAIRFFISNAITSPGVKEALQAALDLKAKHNATQQELANVNEQLRVINEDQTRLRANLREMPNTAAAYKRYLEKFDKQETEIESLRDSQKKLQGQELKDRQEVDRYLRGLNIK